MGVAQQHANYNISSQYAHLREGHVTFHGIHVHLSISYSAQLIEHIINITHLLGFTSKLEPELLLSHEFSKSLLTFSRTGWVLKF